MPERITVKDIAGKLGVSMMTVSRALNNRPNVDDKTRKRIVEAAREMGYIQNQIARSLVQKKTFTIGVVVPEISHSFFPETIRGIEEVFNKAGYQIILTHSAEDSSREISALETLASKRVDGILISMAENVSDYAIYNQIIKMKLPLVFFDRCVIGIGASCVKIEDEESARNITQHLIDEGYRRIAHIRGPKSLALAEARFTGYKKALIENKIKYDTKLVVEAGFHEELGYSAMMKLLQLSEEEFPDAVVCVNDPAAFGAINAIHQKGLKVPEDIAITGFSDDIRANLITPPLTTVRQSAYKIGFAAAKKLIAHIDNENEKIETINIETELVVRASSKKE